MHKTTTPNIPGMTDTLEFVKNLWGGMNVPGVGGGMAAGAPMSTDELDKKITDLKAVEAWLNMNMTMLRGTIHALEVQRGTIATLKSVGESMAQAMGQAGEQANAMAAPFAQFFNQPGAGAPANGAAGHAKPQASAQGAAHGGPQAGAAKTSAEPPPFAAGVPAAMAWWNLLQEQFTQAVASAMSAPEVMAGAAAMAQDAAARFAAAGTSPSAAKGEAGEAKAGSAQPGASRPKPAKSGPDKS
jgi:hypothetical protein